MSQRSLTGLLSGAIALVATALLGSALIRERSVSAELRVSNREVELQSATRLVELRGLRQVVRRQSLGDQFLAGKDASTGRDVAIGDARDGLYLFITGSCQACLESSKMLSSLAATHPDAPVMEIAVDSARDIPITRFTRVERPSGSLLQFVPTNALPIAVVVRDGHIVEMLVGMLKPTISEYLSSGTAR